MEQVMKLEDFMKELSENGLDGTSKYKLRNENIQSRDRTARLPKVKKELKKKEKLLIPLELAIPFNPMTGKVDDTYGPDNKFRPILSATKVSLMLKELANRNEDTKKAFMSRAGVESWDTSDATQLTVEDRAIFKKYLVPVVYTLPVVNVNIPALTGTYGRDYTINVERDPITGNLLNPDDEPLVLQANRFFRDVCYEEIAAYQKKIDDGIVNDTEKVQLQTKQNIYGKNPVSDDHPSNWLVVIDLPLRNNYVLDTENGISYAGMNVEELRSRLYLIRMNKALKDSLDKYKNGEWTKYDKYYDYWEIDMSCPNEGNTPAEIGQGTNYEKPQEMVEEFAHFEKLNQAIIDYLNDRQDIEKIFLASVRIAPYDNRVEGQLATALKTVIDLNSEWVTEEVIKRHADFLTIVMGEEADAILLEVEMGASNRAAGELNESKSKEEYDLNKILTDEEEDVNLEELDILEGTE